MGDVELLIVEDHPLFCSGLRHMADALRPDWRIRFVASAATAVSAIEAEIPQAAVIDIRLADDDGFDLARLIGARWPHIPILMISAQDTPHTVMLAQRSGARGFVSKGEPPETIVAAIDAVLAGDTSFPRFDGAIAIPTLTQRQGEVLALLEQGCSNKEMRYRMGIAERTVRAHLTEVFALLQVHSRTQALIRARDLGLIR